MKMIGETAGLRKLQNLKERFSSLIRENYEHKAKSCSTCETPGACCLDAHFVNVRITRLESRAIIQTLDDLPGSRRDEILRKIDIAITIFRLEEDDGSNTRTYACPLYERGVGCIVHDSGKPLPCIHHACYENEEDLPPSELLDEAEANIAGLDQRVYGSQRFLPLPVAVKNAMSSV
jgi:hypothetical protein